MWRIEWVLVELFVDSVVVGACGVVLASERFDRMEGTVLESREVWWSCSENRVRLSSVGNEGSKKGKTGDQMRDLNNQYQLQFGLP